MTAEKTADKESMGAVTTKRLRYTLVLLAVILAAATLVSVTPAPAAVGEPMPRTQEGYPDPASGNAENNLDAEVILLGNGERPGDILLEGGLSAFDAFEAARALDDVVNMNRLVPGQEFRFEHRQDGTVFSVSMPMEIGRTAVAFRNPDGPWQSQDRWSEVVRIPVEYRAVVKSSLFGAAIDSEIPLETMMEAIHLFSFDVDFQRDIQPGNRITLLGERRQEAGAGRWEPGDLLYAKLELGERSVEFWRYQRLDGTTDWYGADGASTRKALLKTPVDGAYVTSGFGRRTHPILGYSDWHRGIDFAAPAGTPVMSSGDGVVLKSGWSDSYGFHVKIRHPNHYETLYAHFTRIAPGIRKGARVSQGQRIGYVGSTGMSTGPHCHYEIIYYGTHVNPSSLEFPPGHELAGEDLRLFELDREAMNASFSLGGV